VLGVSDQNGILFVPLKVPVTEHLYQPFPTGTIAADKLGATPLTEITVPVDKSKFAVAPKASVPLIIKRRGPDIST
jgi:hypothetical protein